MTREEADEFFNGVDESPLYTVSYHDGQFFLKNSQGEIPLPDGSAVTKIDNDEEDELCVVISGDGFEASLGNNREWFIE